MASISTTLPLSDGTWQVHITHHDGTPYAHLWWHGRTAAETHTLGALSEPEVLDLLEACRFAIDTMRIAPSLPDD